VEVWPAIASERKSLVAALAELPADAWARPSLCPGWSVRDVVAHLVATSRMTPPAFAGKMARARFRFHEMSRREIDRITAGASGAELVDALAARVDARTAPPGPALSWLGETVVHGEDVFRALGPYREHPREHLVAVADFYASSNLLIGAKKRIEGLRLRATDAEWTHGSGPEAAGPMVALVMAMTGRGVACDDLTGEGVATLRARS
jgi:uncharacterized protein (TIGR03083 family)